MTRSARSNSEFAAAVLELAGAKGTARQPYAERWLGYPVEVRRRLAGSPERQAELDGLAGLPADERAPLTAAASERMRLVVKQLQEAKAWADRLRAYRNALMIEKAILGAQQSHIAEEAGVSAMMVCHALATAGPRAKRRPSSSEVIPVEIPVEI